MFGRKICRGRDSQTKGRENFMMILFPFLYLFLIIFYSDCYFYFYSNLSHIYFYFSIYFHHYPQITFSIDDASNLLRGHDQALLERISSGIEYKIKSMEYVPRRGSKSRVIVPQQPPQPPPLFILYR